MTDPSNASDSATKSVTLTLVDDAPTVATSAASTSYTENDPAVAIDPALTLSDPDSATLASAEVKLTDAVSGDRIIVPAAYPVPGALNRHRLGDEHDLHQRLGLGQRLPRPAPRHQFREHQRRSDRRDASRAVQGVGCVSTITAATSKAVAVTP